MPRDPSRARPKHIEGRPKCNAKKTTNGEACQLPAGFGTDHIGYGRCKHHGGNTPSGAMHGGSALVRDLMVLYGQPVEIQPSEALLQEVKRSAGHVQWLGDMIRQMGEAAQEQMAEADYDAMRGLLVTLTEQGYRAASFVDVYRKEREHLARVAKLAIDAGIAERHVQIAEQQGAMVAQAMQRILDQLGLTAEQRRAAPAIVRGELLSLGSGEGAA